MYISKEDKHQSMHRISGNSRQNARPEVPVRTGGSSAPGGSSGVKDRNFRLFENSGSFSPDLRQWLRGPHYLDILRTI